MEKILKPSMMINHGISNRTIIIGIVCVGILFRFYFFAFNNNGFSYETLFAPDEQTYFNIATKITGVDFFKSESSVQASIFQPIFIAIFFRNIFLIKTISIILGGVIIYLTYLISQSIFKNDSIALFSALIVAIQPDLISYSSMLLTENNFTLFVLSFLFFFIRAFQNKNKANIVWASFFFVLAVLERPAFEYFLFSLLLLTVCCIFFRREDSKHLFKTTAVIVLMAYSVLSIFHIKNYYYFNKLYLVTGKGAALFLGSDFKYEGDDPPLRGGTYLRVGRAQKSDSHISISGDENLTNAAMQRIKKHFKEWLFIDIKKIGRLTFGNYYYWTSQFDANKSGTVDNGNEFFQYFRCLFDRLLVITGFSGLLWAIWKNQGIIHVLMFGLIIYTISIYSVTFAIMRYFHPMYPILIIYGVYLLFPKKDNAL